MIARSTATETRPALRGLYALTDAALQAPEQLAERVSLAIDGGATLIQYRDKSGHARVRLQQARTLADLCRARGVLFIVNDDAALAAACDAHGVHLGRTDMDLRAARRLLGNEALIGVSCYNDLSLARAGAAGGADYLAFGRFFPSRTKPAAVQADPALLRQAKRELSLPIAAIGGITPDNAGELLAAGADMLAVVHSVFAATDIRAAATAISGLFTY
ncbi:MAG TPA: thiamine phosphate synthase [Gammaproteobacteria bacterium]|nr:thiamine phosphate synthase [Gammaproteobacteria bacterium]